MLIIIHTMSLQNESTDRVTVRENLLPTGATSKEYSGSVGGEDGGVGTGRKLRGNN